MTRKKLLKIIVTVLVGGGMLSVGIASFQVPRNLAPDALIPAAGWFVIIGFMAMFFGSLLGVIVGVAYRQQLATERRRFDCHDVRSEDARKYQEN